MTNRPPKFQISRKGAEDAGGNAAVPPGPAPGGATHPPAKPHGDEVTRDQVLARFIRICSAVFSTPVPREAAALIVNRISELVRVDRAVLVRLSGKNPILAVTGGGSAAQDSAFADAVETVRKRFRERTDTLVVPPVPDQGKEAAPYLQKVQRSMGGTRILWLPLWLSRDVKVAPKYALWLERWHNHPWDKADIELLQHAALFLGHGLNRSRPETNTRKRFTKAAVLLAALIFLALPVTSSITAPSRVVPDRPHHIFAPMDGILKELYVRPGQWVEKDDILFRYDSRVLDKRLDEAFRNVSVAKAKFARLEGAAHRDPEARAELPVAELEVERAEADARFFADQQARADVRTAEPGVVVLDDPDSLIGAAIQTGQAVMSVADPSRTKMRVMVPAADIGFLKQGARVSVRLDSDPLHSHPAVITRIGFEVKLSENQIPSVLAEAIWLGDPPAVQPGQKGTAKVYGPSTVMAMQILRKPLIALRSITGL